MSCLLLLCTVALWGQSPAERIHKAFNEPAEKSILVVSHRADWRNAPENSLQAIQNCIDMGVLPRVKVNRKIIRWKSCASSVCEVEPDIKPVI